MALRKGFNYENLPYDEAVKQVPEAVRPRIAPVKGQAGSWAVKTRWIQRIADNPIVDVAGKSLDVVGAVVDTWNFVRDPSVENGADAGFSLLGLGR